MRRLLVLASLCVALVVAAMFAGQAGAAAPNLTAGQSLCLAQGGQFIPTGAGFFYSCVNTSGVAFTDAQIKAATSVCNFAVGGLLRHGVPYQYTCVEPA